MSKIATIVNSVDEALKIKDYTDAYLLPLNNFSINYFHTFTIKQINKVKKLNKEIFIILNKNIHNDELDNLKETLLEIENLNIEAIIFYDIALVNLKKKLNLKTKLVWHQEHLVTNYGAINYWYEKGVDSAYLSSEITKREMDEIRENTKAKLFVNIFGIIPMFTSKRHLINNYLDTFNLKSDNKNMTIYKEGKFYKLNDSDLGTTVYTDYILNMTKEDLHKFDYVVFNSNLISDEKFKEVLEKYKEGKSNKFKEETGFLYKETIYKVK